LRGPAIGLSLGAHAHYLRLAAGTGESARMRELFVLLLERVELACRRWAARGGTLRALDALFGEDAAARTDDEPLRNVAERRARYGSPAAGLAALAVLAAARGVTMDALAETVDLPPEPLASLDGSGVPGGVAPAALLARLGAALDVGPSRMAEALAWRGTTRAARILPACPCRRPRLAS
jgi:hypothetical protein